MTKLDACDGWTWVLAPQLGHFTFVGVDTALLENKVLQLLHSTH